MGRGAHGLGGRNYCWRKTCKQCHTLVPWATRSVARHSSGPIQDSWDGFNVDLQIPPRAGCRMRSSDHAGPHWLHVRELHARPLTSTGIEPTSCCREFETCKTAMRRGRSTRIALLRVHSLPRLVDSARKLRRKFTLPALRTGAADGSRGL